MPYDNSNSGLLCRNERKRDNKDPDFSGSANVAGIDYWLVAWVNEGKPGSKMEGKRYFSIKFNEKGSPRAAVTPRDDDMAPTTVGATGSGNVQSPPLPPQNIPPPTKTTTILKTEDDDVAF